MMIMGSTSGPWERVFGLYEYTNYELKIAFWNLLEKYEEKIGNECWQKIFSHQKIQLYVEV